MVVRHLEVAPHASTPKNDLSARQVVLFLLCYTVADVKRPLKGAYAIIKSNLATLD